MSTLKNNFNYKLNGSSPVHVLEDLALRIKKDKDGNSIPVFEPIDYKKIAEDNGTVDMWQLDNLLAAGINPDFPVHTGYNTRLEGIGELGSITEGIDEWLASQKNNEEVKSE